MMECSFQSTAGSSQIYSQWFQFALPQSGNMAFFSSPNPVTAHNASGALDVEGQDLNSNNWFNTYEVLDQNHHFVNWNGWSLMVGSH